MRAGVKRGRSAVRCRRGREAEGNQHCAVGAGVKLRAVGSDAAWRAQLGRPIPQRDDILRVRRLQRAAWGWFTVPPPPAARRQRAEAVLVQRASTAAGRRVLNEDAVLASLRRAGFAAGVLVPEQSSLREMLQSLRRAD